MYSKKEETILKEQFWMALGTYMRPVPSAGGERINWVNYKTGQKNIRFVMQADTSIATVAIEVSHNELPDQLAAFEKFQQLRKLFDSTAGTGWQWLPLQVADNGKTVSRISTSIDGVNILDKHDWPRLISFLKENMVALDEFWEEYKFMFEM